MKTLVIYDSLYGNTEKIAHAIANGLSGGGCVEVLHVDAVTLQDVISSSLLIVGSPTQGGRATHGVQNFLTELPKQALSQIRVAAFDTRFDAQDRSAGLKLLMKTIGYASGKIAHQMMSKGGQLVASPEGFIVETTNGPLREGELERAAIWAAKLRSSQTVPAV